MDVLIYSTTYDKVIRLSTNIIHMALRLVLRLAPVLRGLCLGLKLDGQISQAYKGSYSVLRYMYLKSNIHLCKDTCICQINMHKNDAISFCQDIKRFMV